MLNILKNAAFCVLLTSCLSSGAQQPDYELIFGDDWKKAEAFERENRQWMEPVLRKNRIPYAVAIAVVFPELVRYSALRDKMEITLLKALYINLGDEYANFSIGRFQIKPSFAALIRAEAPSALTGRSGISFMTPEESGDIKNYRKSIVADMEDVKTQFTYIVAFLRICDKKFSTGKKDESSRVKFLATAYNCGIDKPLAQIESMTGSKYFSTKLVPSETYCYADISLYWYRKFTEPGK